MFKQTDQQAQELTETNGDQDFSFFFKITRFVLNPEVLSSFDYPPGSLSEDEGKLCKDSPSP